MEEVKNAVEKVAEEVFTIDVYDFVAYSKGLFGAGFAYGVTSVFAAYYGGKLCVKVIDKAVLVADIGVNHVKQKRKQKRLQKEKEAAKAMQQQETVNN